MVRASDDHSYRTLVSAGRAAFPARASASFSHHNVVTVHDYGVDGVPAFLVMECLDGNTLREEIARHKTRQRNSSRALDQALQ